MILDNYWKYQQAICNVGGVNDYQEANTGVLATDGGVTTVLVGSVYNNMDTILGVCANKAIKYDCEIHVGTGDTAESSDQYSLANDITASLGNRVQSHTVAFENGKLKTTFMFSATNNSNSTITIKEVGIFKIFLATRGGTHSTSIFARKVLDNPLEVLPNTSFTINFEWEEN
jgi:hypothetical protein